MTEKFDFSKCNCDEPGFCPVFKKEMGISPPNWKWCQDASECEREEYHKRSSRQLRTLRNAVLKGKVKVVKFVDELPEKKSDLAVCVIPANDKAGRLLSQSRQSIQDYAEKCGADYIELEGDQHPDWPMANKYRVHKVAKTYKKTLYLDCDVVVKPEVPNIFDETPDDKISACCDFSLFKKWGDTHWITREQEIIVHKMFDQKHPNMHNGQFKASAMLNGGVMVIPQECADLYQQPEKEYPRQWCFDQHYLSLTIPQDRLYPLDPKWNNRTVSPANRKEYNVSTEFWEQLEDCYFIHVNGLSSDKYMEKMRMDLIERFSNGDFRKRANPELIKPGTFITNARLIEDTLKMIEYLPPIQGIIGVPRSGMFPASILSVAMSLPLYSFTNGELVKLSADEENGGSRMSNFQPKPDDLPFLVIDDTSYSGGAMFRTRILLNQKYGYNKYIYTTVYHEPSSAYHLYKDGVVDDYLLDILNNELYFPHVLEWNLFNAHPAQLGMFDLDGVFCPDCSPEDNLDDDRYVRWMTTVQPYKARIPELFPCMAICTARPEQFRPETEEWLDKHGIPYGKLFMWEGTKAERDKNGRHVENVAEFKRHKFETYSGKITISHSHKYSVYTSEPIFFIESCPLQSRLIAQTDKPHRWVISINEKVTIDGNANQ